MARLCLSTRPLLLLSVAFLGLGAVGVEGFGFGLHRASPSSRRTSILAFAGGADGQQPYKPKVWAYHRSRSKIIEWCV